VLHEVDAMRDAVRGTKAVRGVLVVSASFSFGTRLIVPRLRALLDKHPGLIVDLRLEDKIVDLVAEGVDVAVRAGSPPPDSTAFVAQEIRSMRRILVAAPRVVRKHGAPKTPDDLAKLPCLLQVTPQGALVRWTLHRGDEQRIVDVDGPVRTNAPITLRELALDGLGVAYVPDWLVNDDVDAGRLRRLLPEWSSHPIMGWAIHRSELRGSPRVRAFVEAMAAP
jgi:DNA-binding transcriptional LysR family regulator